MDITCKKEYYFMAVGVENMSSYLVMETNIPSVDEN